jgi:acetyl esterase/lipase
MQSAAYLLVHDDMNVLCSPQPIRERWCTSKASSVRWLKIIAWLSILTVAGASAACGQQAPASDNVHQPAVNAAGEPLEKLPPFKLPAGVTLEKDLTYAQYGTRTVKLDLYRPSTGKGPFPGVVFIHGGAWKVGTKSGFSNQAAYLATKGYVCVSIDYRLSPEAPYPAAIYDAKAAVRWMRANAPKYKIDPNKIAAAGGSAGGQLVALLGTSWDVRTMEGDGGNAQFSSRVQAVVAFNPATDFVSLLARTQNPHVVIPAVTQFLGGTSDQIPEIYIEASPITHVSSTSPPFLFLHGTGDMTLPYRQSLEMQSALQAVGVRADLFSAKDANHGFFNYPPFYQPTIERAQQFLDSVFKKH